MDAPVDPVLDLTGPAVPDADELVRAAVAWHFDPATGSPFWLRRAATLGFDPVADVRCWAHLTRFPNVVNELRDVPARDLVPRGYGPDPEIVAVFESGGTTGSPKRVVLLPDWRDRFLGWTSTDLDRCGVPRGLDYLVVGPTGPHAMGWLGAELARRRGGLAFHVDFDPRWAKKLATAGDATEAGRYSDHLIEQAADVLRSQDIGVLVITPPLLERMTRHEALVELVNRKVVAFYTAGASMDPDTRHLLRTEIFPRVALHGSYGGTMALCPTATRIGTPTDDPVICDPFSPYVTFAVVDPDTGLPVPYGERGQVVMHHVSKAMFLPNNAERDLATRVAGRPGQIGDSVSDVAPMLEFDGAAVVEGVY